jgi:Mrp family chromosome partitioning ATPase
MNGHRLSFSEDTLMPVTIVVSNRKGGAGKTTVAVNLAAELAALGRRVLLLDLDLPASAQAAPQEEPLNLRQAREGAEYRVMVRALARADGNIARAAELLGVSRPTLYDLMGHHGIK